MPGVKKRMLPAVTAVLVAGLVLPGALGVAAAAKVPFSGPVTWSSERGPVPKAVAHTAPALTSIAAPGPKESRLLFWTGPSIGGKDFQISYQTSISLRKNLWTAPNLVDGGKATTNSRPAATPDLGPPASPVPGLVMVVWKEAKGSSIMYSIGRAGKSTKLAWSSAAAVPGAATSNGPAAFTTFSSNDILIVWKDASSDAIDFIVGIPISHGGVKWGKVGTIPGAATATTPAVAEVATGKSAGTVGEVYVLWKTVGSTGRIDFSVAAETPLKLSPPWSKPGALPAAITTPTAPSAEAVGTGDMLPLLVVYQKPGGSALDYVTMAAGGAVKGPYKVPQLESTNGTTIDNGVLAAQAPAPVSTAHIFDPNNIFYLPYVRPCAGC